MTVRRARTTNLGRMALAALLAASLATGAFAHGGSETRDGSVVIKKLPFTGMGDTGGHIDNSDAVCDFPDSTAPDLYYRITPLTDVYVNISLCNSAYDTKVYVLDPQDEVVACNDDFCVDEDEDPTLRSELECFRLQGGIDYDIAVDGFGTESGAYEIVVTECEPPPPFACPKEAAPEGETCQERSDDNYNGGCNADPPIYSAIECGDVICGGTWYDVTFSERDTDWYEVVTTETTTLTLRGSFHFDTGRLGFIQMAQGEEGSGDCDDALGQFPFARGDNGEIITVTSDPLPAGIHWIFIAAEYNGIPIACDGDNEYWFELTCGDDDPCPGDITGDSFVDFNDLLQVLDGWGPCPK